MAGKPQDERSSRVAAAPPERERRPDWRQGGLRAAGAAAARIAGPIVASRGGGMLARLKAEWIAVVGAELAALTWPDALGRDGALKLRVALGSALELQHRAPLVIERINNFFGRGVIARLVLVQGPLPLAEAPARRRPATTLRDDEKGALDDRLADIADPELRAALSGLGRLVLAHRGGS